MKRFHHLFRPVVIGLAAFAAWSPGSGLRAEDHWPQFRGPTGRGHSTAKGVPLKWNAASVAWKTKLKGEGQSSPVNWGDRLFLTSASGDGRQRHVICVDRTSGDVLWERTVACDGPEHPHRMNSFATPTCATDGKHVVAFFGPGGIHCFDLEGEKKWSRDLGDFPGPWGVAASPVIVGNKVIQNCDAEGPSSLVALDLDSGEPMWTTEREPKPRGGWSTPILIDAGGRRELVLNGEFGVRGYDPETGKELWFCKGFNGRGAPVPEFANGLLHVVNGKPGDTYAVKPGGTGNVTDSRMVWHTKRRGGRDLPSPVVVDGFLLVVSMSGTASCYDARTGKLHYEEKLGVKGEFAASPLVVDGHILIQNVYGGATVVIKPGKKLEIVSINELGADVSEIFRATLAPVRGEIFARSLSTLYCIRP
ncbi:MAG: PQQ-binding-like beta-propeller repeat protein [Akkermansiaceae bacterium]|nr:PQQ-binding-like beta-propeller repeat protein [Akkermansiaceae bacterium]NNM30666.1 PQQ-binding-like beta-propeller repeat protein [Akkermansiaceae bacterium]